MKNTLSLILFFISMANAQGFSFYGEAYDPKNGNLLYKEVHKIDLDKNGRYATGIVEYSDASNEIFATKKLDYQPLLTVPNLLFKDTRTGTQVLVDKENAQVRVKYTAADDYESGVINLSEYVVVDAGFDQMLINKWPVLLKEETLTFDFLLPTRAELISFELIPEGQNETEIKFSLEPSSMILKFLVDPIKLTYDKSTKRILRYEGLTNIEEVKKGKITGDYLVAVINYYYP